MSAPKAETVQLSVRVPANWLARLDAIAAEMSRPGIELSRADALRAAVAEGILVLAKPIGVR